MNQVIITKSTPMGPTIWQSPSCFHVSTEENRSMFLIALRIQVLLYITEMLTLKSFHYT